MSCVFFSCPSKILCIFLFKINFVIFHHSKLSFPSNSVILLVWFVFLINLCLIICSRVLSGINFKRIVLNYIGPHLSLCWRQKYLFQSSTTMISQKLQKGTPKWHSWYSSRLSGLTDWVPETNWFITLARSSVLAGYNSLLWGRSKHSRSLRVLSSPSHCLLSSKGFFFGCF